MIKTAKIWLVSIKLICLSLVVLLSHHAEAQSSDDQYKRPLGEVLENIEELFGVRLKYDEGVVKNQWLPYADWRIRKYSLEETLSNVLSPFDLGFHAEGEKTYEIKSYRYSRRPVEDARKDLDYLSGLYSDEASWEARKGELRACMISALALDRLPAAPRSKPVKGKRRTMDGYTVQNIAIETLPGVYVAGSLYQPLRHKGSSAIVLAPNGHFGDGRYRADQQYRCATLARMGAITFSYDLFAWGESLLQFDKEDHQKSIAQTVQIANGLRILDYLVGLKGADPDRIAVTGGSGGGSQTMQLTAIDDRIKVSVPVVMLSAHFFGGCPCESGRPIHLCGNGTNNAEIAAMAAPRPQLIISDGRDWTHTVPELEFPFVQSIYAFYDKVNNVQNAHFEQEGHDYGASKRQAMYRFMAKHLDLDLERVLDQAGNVGEKAVTIEAKADLLVFGKNGERFPDNAITDIDQLYRMIEEENKEKK